MEFIIVSFATFALTTAITTTDGPFAVFRKLRDFGKLFECFTCCAVWTGALFSLLVVSDVKSWFLLTFAAAGGAILLDYIGDRY